MGTCKFCNSENSDTAKWCKYCGEKLLETETKTETEGKQYLIYIIAIAISIFGLIKHQIDTPINKLISGCTDNGTDIDLYLVEKTVYYCKNKPWDEVIIYKNINAKNDNISVYKNSPYWYGGQRMGYGNQRVGNMAWENGEYVCRFHGERRYEQNNCTTYDFVKEIRRITNGA